TVLSQLLDGVQTAIRSATAAEGSYTDRLDALTDAITAMLGKEPHAARLLMREAMDWGPVMPEELSSTVQELLSASALFAKAGQREGAFNAALDAEHLVVSLIGIYFMPFVIDRTVERLAGKSPFEAPFIEDRRRAVREQIRRLFLVNDGAAQ